MDPTWMLICKVERLAGCGKTAPFAAQDIFPDRHALRFAEKSQIFQPLRSALSVPRKKYIRAHGASKEFFRNLLVDL